MNSIIRHLSISLVILVEFCYVSIGQTSQMVQILDQKTQKPIPYCHVIEQAHKSFHVADINGSISITVKEYPLVLSISHVSYQDTIVRIDQANKGSINIYLSPLTIRINEVQIEAGRLKKFFSKENFYVTDFVFQRDRFWVLGYADKNVFKQEIAIIDLRGKVLARSESPVEGKVDELFLDAYGNVHAINKTVMAQLFVLEKSIIPLYSFENKNVSHDLKKLELFVGNSAIFKERSGESNCHDYIAVDTTTFEVDTIISLFNGISFADAPEARKYEHPPIPSVGGRWWLADIDTLIAHGMDPRENLTFDPSDAFTGAVMDRMARSPIKTSVYLYDKGIIFSTDRKPFIHYFDLERDQKEEYSYEQLYGNDLLDLMQDPVTKEVYWVWLERGIITISQVNPVTWQLSAPYHVPGLSFPDKILIANNKCYFIHRMALNNGFSNFYSYDLPFEE